MDTKPAPTGNDPEFKRPLGPTPPTSPTPAPLGNFDFDREVDERPMNPGPLLQQKPLKPNKKGSAKTVIMVLLTILLLAAVGAAAYMYWMSNDYKQQAENAHTQLNAQMVENEKLKQAAAKAEQESDEPAELTAAQKTAADKTAITGVLTAKLHAPTKSKDEKLTVNIMKQNDSFAYANAGPASGGAAAYILKKVDNVWTIVYSGQEKVTQEVVDQYTIPTEFQSGQ